MSALSPLPRAVILAWYVSCVMAQIPTNVSPCIRTCGTVKVSEGYCSNPAVFAAAYDQCLRQNCNSGDVNIGLTFTNSICNSTNGAVPPAATNTTTAPAPIAPGNLTNATGTNTPATNALRAAGAGTLATLLGTPAGQSYVSQLQQGPHTLFAPVDGALAQLPLNSTSPTDLTALLDYHTVPGTLDVSRLPTTGHSIVRTSLRGNPYVNLPANDSQVLVLAVQPNGVLTIIEPTRNVTVSNFTRADNVELSTIQNVLTVPGTLAATVAGIPELTTLVSAINTSAPQLFGQLDQTPGLTIFAPINSALVNPLTGANLQSTLLNHIVNGTVLYSTTIGNITNATAAGGAHIDFISNTTGAYARADGKEVLIVQSDIITRNGVVHLVNGVFNPSNSTPTLPLVNSNNSSETAGITQVDGAQNNAAQNAQNSAGPTSFSIPRKLVVGSAVLLCGALAL